MTGELRLAERHRREIASLLRRYVPDAEVWAYGSRVDGRGHDGSDLDLVLRGAAGQALPLGRLAGLAEALRDSNIPFLVEARDWARLPDNFRREIERKHVVLIEGARNR